MFVWIPCDGAFHMFQVALPEELSLLALSFARLLDPGCEPIFDQIVASLTPRRPVALVAVIPWGTAMVGVGVWANLANLTAQRQSFQQSSLEVLRLFSTKSRENTDSLENEVIWGVHSPNSARSQV